MKKFGIAIILIFLCFSVEAQFYISGTGGYALPSAGVRFGTETTTSGIENTYGSYGEGIHAQLRGGYFFNEKFGVEIAVGYLHGADQTINKVNLPGQPGVDIIARGRAFGLSPVLIYNFNDNIYGRFGALFKIGGRTEGLIALSDVALPAGSIPNVPIPTTLDVSYQQNFFGRLPLGFVGSLGYKHHLSDKVALFGEVEYIGISITRDRSEIEDFSASLREVPGSSLSIAEVRTILAAGGNPLAASLYPEIDYVDEVPLNNTDGTRQLSQKVPYSSFGINLGITFTFGSAKQAQAN